MTETLLVALLALITAMAASVLLVPSSHSAEPAVVQVQWLAGQAPRATLFGASPHAITECGR
jgi:hypothetical protein